MRNAFLYSIDVFANTSRGIVVTFSADHFFGMMGWKSQFLSITRGFIGLPSWSEKKFPTCPPVRIERLVPPKA